VHRDGKAIREMNITEAVYDWYGDEQWEWFRLPKQLNKGVWSAPYFDEGAGNVLMVTYSTPFYRDRTFRGVTTVDLEIPILNETVGRHIVGDQPFYVLAHDATYIYSTITARIGRKIADVMQEHDRLDIAESADAALKGDFRMIEYPGIDNLDPPGEKIWSFHAPIESAGWVFGTTIYESKALAEVRSRMLFAAIALALTLVLIITCILFVAGRITRPISLLRERVAEISAGNLDARVEGIRSRDEIGELAGAFNRMTSDLRTHVQQLASEKSARAKIEQDLALAKRIQQGLLPKGIPNLPGYAFAGWNQAADQTGGDYFDWLELPDGKTIITLADVTGHGIGPALIVAACRAYMRAAAISAGEASLASVLGRVNNLLHEDVADMRFVTAAVALLDPRHHVMSIISAGHAPLLFYQAATNTVQTWNADDLPLAIAGGVEYPEARIVHWQPGDILVLVTDGFFEWMNASRQQYGTVRLSEFVIANARRDPADFIAALHQAVLAHAQGTTQADDLTAVVIKRTAQ
jgi:sigma-B regulation protein RsbU (phosphoserine phosphatase)